jgi:hypothetical protein
MAIPDFQAVMLPVLRDLAQGERTGQQTIEAHNSHRIVLQGPSRRKEDKLDT